MSNLTFDNPLVRSIVFHPRSAPAEFTVTTAQGVSDGTIAITSDVVLGYRLYRHLTEAPLILYFHGNGEIASDYDDISSDYKRIGASLLVVDYRGYGWSTGQPNVSTLLSDMTAVQDVLPDLLRRHGISGERVFVMGRSLGSACAIHLAHEYPERFRGLIIESGFTELLRLAWIPAALGQLLEPINSLQKIAHITLPLLVIHGERDIVIPVAHGQTLFDTSPAELKRIVRIAGAGHNDLLRYGAGKYFEAIRGFIS